MKPQVDWVKLGDLPETAEFLQEATEQNRPAIGVAGAFTGVHNDALIVAGGTNFPIPSGENLWSDATQKISYDDVWVATRGDAGELIWHDTGQKFPSRRGYGAMASHRLGAVFVGGTDGAQSYADAYLLRWSNARAALEIVTLPSLPRDTVDGAAAVIDDVIYLVAGSDGANETSELYSLDLSGVCTDEQDRLVLCNPEAVSEESESATGEFDRFPEWQKLPSIPDHDGFSSKRSNMMVAAQQGGGNSTELFVIGGRRVVDPADFPDAVPAGLGDDRPYLHFLSDVWAYNPQSKAWSQRGEVVKDGAPDARSAGTAIAVGENTIILLTGAKGDLLEIAFGSEGSGWTDFPHTGFERDILAYDTASDSWSVAGQIPLVADPIEGSGHRVSAGAVTTQAVCWGGKAVLVSGELRPRVRTPAIWQADFPQFGAAICDGTSGSGESSDY